MRRRGLGRAFVVMAVIAGMVSCADDGLTRRAPFGAVTPADGVVAIRATGCRRTSTRSVGVVIAPGLVATVAHPVAGERELSVLLADGTSLEAEVAAIDTELDLAVVRVAGLGAPAVPVGDAEAGPAEFVDAPDGAPVIDPVDVVRTVTVRTSDIYRDGVFERPGLELASASVEPGDSGGGLFQSGRLVGVVWGTSRLDRSRAWATEIGAYAPLITAASSGEVAAPVACGR